ncbi:DUF4055 domain-containing protein [Erythrobacter arachoides]|uniref:DUF4055 domain-containing protein n=1 Tax=Aurantiacibacter arachoides TaxID=1850444 RepID=A0A845A551_9SPHN|nr:DUF4055 domain-containing protein [Aurantiacibacter arachoides]MXO94286.1 DUF4055 domain-containing protein [Aurantiacibacter arachoides]GGD64671.1 hypothetical protein GCM10011411_26220 [Aurantiacibacter arachoides]
MMIDTYDEKRAVKLPLWKRNRDHTSGTDAVKTARTEYLPLVGAMEGPEYLAHLAMVEYKPAAARTLASHVGLVFRKPATISPDGPIKDLCNVIEADGSDITTLAKWALREYSVTNDGGILIDHPVMPDGLSLAAALALDLRPFASRYTAEMILSVQTSVIGGRKKISRVVLKDDEKTFRELTLENGVYTITVHTKDGGRITETKSQPTVNGKPLTSIPFVHLADGEDHAAFSDIVNTNVTHYLTAAELATALKWCAKPRLTIVGLPDDVALDHDPAIAWRFSDKDTKVEYNEFKGTGIVAIERQLDRLVKSMAEQGLRLLMAEQAPAEAAETAQRREASENSILASHAHHISTKLTAVLRFIATWLGLENDRTMIALNVDFIPSTVDPQVLQQLVALNQAGKLSDRQLFINLQKGEIISGDVDFDQHQVELENTVIDPPIDDDLA